MSHGPAARRGQVPASAALAAGVLLVSIAVLVHGLLRPSGDTGQAAPGAEPARPGTADAVARFEAPMPRPGAMPTPTATPTPAGLERPAVSVAAPRQGTSSAPPAVMPYRFIGRTGSGAGTAIVLFGRGRVVTLHGPGPLDDEVEVEAVFDDYLVLRHRPSGAGSFVALAQRQPVLGAPEDPEDSPRD